MGDRQKSVKFSTALSDDGTLRVPEELAKIAGLTSGALFEVRLTRKTVSDRLKRLGVTEREIDTIGAVQLSSRDQVVGFLLAEGAFRGVKRGVPGKRRRRKAHP
jgi:hypothetical protein